MVRIVRNFRIIKEHVEQISSRLPYFRVYYMIKSEGGKKKVKIIAGSLGYETYLTRVIKEWLRNVKAVRVSRVEDEDMFFSKKP